MYNRANLPERALPPHLVSRSHIQQNAYKQFLYDCGLVNEDLPPERWDELFKQLNASTDKQEDDRFNHRLGLNRQEFLELLLRAAILRYVLPAKITNRAEAVHKLMDEDIIPNVLRSNPMALQNANDFRLEHCYVDGTDRVLRKHQETLENLYNHYAQKSTRDEQ